MSNSNYFNQALHDMIFENACGAAIKRLADKSFPISYIHKQLDYPISFERVQRYVWQYYLDNKTLIYPDDKIDYTESNNIIIINEPKIKKTFIKEQGPYGKTTFRQVAAFEEEAGNSNNKNNSTKKYIACDFGIFKNEKPDEFNYFLDSLDSNDKAYIIDLPWENKRVYHIMNKRMISIFKA